MFQSTDTIHLNSLLLSLGHRASLGISDLVGRHQNRRLEEQLASSLRLVSQHFVQQHSEHLSGHAARLHFVLAVAPGKIVKLVTLPNDLNYSGNELLIGDEETEDRLVTIAVHKQVVKQKTETLDEFECVVERLERRSHESHNLLLVLFGDFSGTCCHHLNRLGVHLESACADLGKVHDERVAEVVLIEDLVELE